jgi:uncharacterized protein
MFRFVITGCLLVTSALAAGLPADYHEAIARAREERRLKLLEPDGWLTLVGLHFLHAGKNTVGSAAGSDVVLAKAPAHLGTVEVAGNGTVTLELADAGVALIDGRKERRAELNWQDTTKPTKVTFGTTTFFAVDRGGKKALRVKDSEAPSRRDFAGLDYFPIDPAWRIVARWEPFERSRLVPITTVLGQTGPEPIPGKAVFEWEGRTIELLPIDEGRTVPLFFVISDATSGKETYGGSRFLYVPWPKEGERTMVLDFNLLENPPCAFTPFSSCPLPPKENRLPFAVRVGEKNYRGPHP